MDDRRANRKGGVTGVITEWPARVIYVSGRTRIRIVVGPGIGMLDFGIPTDIDLELVPFELRTPNTDLLVTSRNGEITAVRRDDRPPMDDQRNAREGGTNAPTLRFRLRLMLLIVALCSVFFAWVGVQHEREHIRQMGELSDQEHIRKSLTDDNIVPGMEAVRKQRVAELEADIAKRREVLGLPAEE
jgi:hypothetical protein